jgi:hypothetical protein
LNWPDSLFRRIKVAAVHEGITTKQLITDALQKRLRKQLARQEPVGPEWMHAYGALRHLRRDLMRVERRTETEFEQIEPEDRV